MSLSDHNITAIYNGDGFHVGSSASLTQTVALISTTTAVVADANPSQPGQPVTFTAAVSTPSGAATGSVTFYDNNTVLGTVALDDNGVATYTTSTLASGSHDIEAIYNGDNTYAASMTSLTQTVSTSTVVVGSGTISGSLGGSIFSPHPGVQLIQLNLNNITISGGLVGGFSLTGEASYSGGSGSVGMGGDGSIGTTSANETGFGGGGPLSYSVSGNTISGTFRLSGTVSNYPTDPRLVSGSGTFSGTISNGTISGTFSGTIALDLAPISYTNVTASAAPSLVGQSATFTATVTGNTSTTPTGTVQFFDGSTLLGSIPLNSSGVATFTTLSLSSGVHNILAVYSGDSTHPGSVASLSQTVNLNATTTSLSSSANPSPSGQSVTFTVTVAAADPNAGTPTGTVSLYDGTTFLGTAALSVVNGQVQATFTTAALALGKHEIIVIYSGDSTFADSGAALEQTISS